MPLEFYFPPFLESSRACLHIMGNYRSFFDAESSHADY